MITLNTVEKAALGLTVLTAVTLSICGVAEAGIGRKKSKWDGKDTAALIEKWGITEDKATLSDGSELWVYRKVQEATIGGQLPTRTTRSYRAESYVDNGKTVVQLVPYDEVEYDPSANRPSICEARFTIKDNVVNSAAIKGDGCP